MKVKSLIRNLKKYNPEAEVYLGDQTKFSVKPIKGVLCSLIDFESVSPVLITQTEVSIKKELDGKRDGFDPRIHYGGQFKTEKKEKSNE